MLNNTVAITAPGCKENKIWGGKFNTFYQTGLYDWGREF